MVKEYLKELGYNDDEIIIILQGYGLQTLKEETLLNNIKRNYNFLISVGYNKEDVIKMTTILPTLYSYTTENIKQKIEDLILLGYSHEEVIKMTKTLPTLYSYSIENIKQKIEDLIILGYSHEEVIKMTKTFPTLYSYSIENIKQKIEDLILLGYSHEEVIKMTKTLPALYGYSIENIKQKIEYFREINLGDIVIVDTKQLMKSVSLTYARYEYFKEKGQIVTMIDYRKLFMGSKKFEKQYGITKQELLEQYNYEKYLEIMNHQR